MCRLFGFRSVIDSQVHRSLVAADNALGRQSAFHADGWGVAYYVDGAPHLTRSPEHAFGDVLFHRVSGVVASQTVVAHIRKATQGPVNVLNCHPFQYGRWVFAHNGNVPGFLDLHRRALRAEVAPRLRRFILGDTDSEVYFFLFLTHLSGHGLLSKSHGVEECAEAMRATVKLIREVCAPTAAERGEELTLTSLVTNGTTMLAHQGGKELFWSTYKTRCADRESCPSLSPECEAPTESGHVNHLIFTSEPLSGENVWLELRSGDLLGIDFRMKMHRDALDRKKLSVVA